MNKQILTTIFAIFISLSFISALSINADYTSIYPGEEGKVNVDIKNNNNFDTESVSIELNLGDVPFIAVGSSEKNIDEIDEGDKENVLFTLKPSTGITPGDYEIPYTLTYLNMDTDDVVTKTGSFGLRVNAKTELDFIIESKTNVIGEKGKISLKIINKGLGEVKFVSVKIFPQGYDLLSTDTIYIGNIASDDSDTASFDVFFNTLSPSIYAKVTYKDLDNKDQSKIVTLPVNVYTQEKALELGIIQKSNTSLYGGIIILLIIIWIVYRKIKKRNKKNNRS
ncbi:MAG: hypothetical protein ABIH28_00570 [archaeon]